MTSTIASTYDEQTPDAGDSTRQERDDFPVGMLASPTRTRL